MFTAENFRRVFDLENRKGMDVVTRFFPHLIPQTMMIKDKVAEIRDLRAQKQKLSAEDFATAETILKTELAKLKAEKSAAIDIELGALSQAVSKPGFKIELEEKMGPQGKPVFCIDSKAETFFVVKQLQRNINRIYGVKQANRHDLACRVRDTLRSPFPFQVVRTDISSFYESINRKDLLGKLDADQLLSSSSKKFIKQTLDSYGALSGNQKGIPRGVGVSAYLAELFLRPIDQRIKRIPGLVLYCRYVDDIVAIFAKPPAGKAMAPYSEQIAAILVDRGLAQNPAKTVAFDLGVIDALTFEYLGYRYTKAAGALTIAPSDAKLKKLADRLSASFEAYTALMPLDTRKAFRELIARVKFLTGNARLKNSKSSATTGIYYNNPLVTDVTGFSLLDTMLKTKALATKRPSLKKRLKPLKFAEGFQARRFHNFSARELRMIVEAWKNA